MYAELKGWKVEILDSNPTEIGGFKEVVFSIEARVRTVDLNTRAGFTGSKGFRQLNRAEESTLPPLRLQCFLKWKRWMCR